MVRATSFTTQQMLFWENFIEISLMTYYHILLFPNFSLLWSGFKQTNVHISTRTLSGVFVYPIGIYISWPWHHALAMIQVVRFLCSHLLTVDQRWLFHGTVASMAISTARLQEVQHLHRIHGTHLRNNSCWDCVVSDRFIPRLNLDIRLTIRKD